MKKLQFMIEIETNEKVAQTKFILNLKKELILRAESFYQAMAEDLKTEEELSDHYTNLGVLIYEIKSIKSFPEFLVKALDDKFQGLVCPHDDEGFVEFLTELS